MFNHRLLAAGYASALMLVSSNAGAQDAAAFFKGNNIRIIVGNSVGGDYDQGTRLLARHLPKYLPGGPSFTVQNMQGAGSVISANYLYETAPRDGSVMGSFSRNLVVSRVRKLRNLRAPVEKFQWLGATSRPGRMCMVRADVPVKSLADLQKQTTIFAGSGKSSIVTIIPTVLNNLMGTKIRVVEGYKGMASMMLALNRGEVQGYCLPADYMHTNHPDMLRDKQVRILFVTEETLNPDYPGVPSIYDQVSSAADKQMMQLLFSGAEFGRPYVYPPDVPAYLVAAMRKAIAEAVKDPELVAEANKTKRDMTYISPQELEQSVATIMALPADILEKAEKLMPVQQR